MGIWPPPWQSAPHPSLEASPTKCESSKCIHVIQEEICVSFFVGVEALAEVNVNQRLVGAEPHSIHIGVSLDLMRLFPSM